MRGGPARCVFNVMEKSEQRTAHRPARQQRGPIPTALPLAACSACLWDNRLLLKPSLVLVFIIFKLDLYC